MASGQYTRMPAQNKGLQLSDLFRDPLVAAAFRRAEKGNGDTFMIPAAPRPLAPSGAEAIA